MSDSTGESAQPTIEDARNLARQLRGVIDETQSDIGRIPIFVRPMAKRGFAKRTGKSFAEWQRFADDLFARLIDRERARTVRPDTVNQLRKLEHNYRTAPERAARFMKDAAMASMVKERSSAREHAVRELIDALHALGIASIAGIE